MGDLTGKTFFEKKHVIFTIANHFEPAWNHNGPLDLDSQKSVWLSITEPLAKRARPCATPTAQNFAIPIFIPAEQYDAGLLDEMAEMQAEGLGDVEIHLHHGVDKPDTADNLRAALIEFRDTLAEKHKCLSRMDGKGDPMYAFVHGNLALGNSCGGRIAASMKKCRSCRIRAATRI